MSWSAIPTASVCALPDRDRICIFGLTAGLRAVSARSKDQPRAASSAGALEGRGVSSWATWADPWLPFEASSGVFPL
jgi:hypothetical protein